MENTNGRQPALVFDFGGVLIEWDPRNLYRKIFNGDMAAVETFLKESNFMEWNIRQDAGRPFSEAVDEYCRQMPQYCELIRAYDQRYEESISGPNWSTVEILRSLKEAGYPLYGLSNWPDEKWRLVRPKYEFFGWFDYILISGEVKLAKPDPRIFRLIPGEDPAPGRAMPVHRRFAAITSRFPAKWGSRQSISNRRSNCVRS